MASEEVRTEPKDGDSLLEICRLCMSTESLENVFELEDLQRRISDYLSITVSPADSISHAICTICWIRLDEFRQFRTRCQEVQATLWSMVRTEETVETSEGSKSGTRLRKNKPIKGGQYHCIESSKRQKKAFDIQAMNIELLEEIDSTTASSYSQEPLERAKGEEESLTGNHTEAANTECAVDRIEIGLVKIEALSDDNTQNDQLKPDAAECDLQFKLDLYTDMEEVYEESMDDIVSNERNFRRNDTGNAEAQVSVQQKDKTVQNKLHHRCDECSRVYPTMRKLNMHKRHVHGERKHACHLCGKGYILPCQLRLHLKRHGEVTRLKCNMCDRYFNHTTSLWHHQTNHHNFCSDCGIQFTTRLHLDRHRSSMLHRINVETNGDSKNEKVIDESCSNDAIDGTDNRMNEIEKTGEAPSKIDENVQQQYQCDKCLKKFMTKKQQQDHFRQVHGERKYTCPVCDKGFITPSDLRAHLRSHDKAGAYSCDVCGKSFKEKSTLYLHKRTEHHSLMFVHRLRKAKLDNVRSAPSAEHLSSHK